MGLIKRVKYTLSAEGWIGVVSDTHIPTRAGHVPKELFRALDGASLILHAGDLVDESVLIDLGSIAPVEAVAGNMDSSLFHRKLGKKKIVSVGGVNIGLVHGRGRVEDAPQRAYREFLEADTDGDIGDVKLDAVVFGHTHYSVIDYYKGVLLLNPGSPVEPRMGSSYSYARLWIENNTIKAKIVPL